MASALGRPPSARPGTATQVTGAPATARPGTASRLAAQAASTTTVRTATAGRPGTGRSVVPHVATDAAERLRTARGLPSAKGRLGMRNTKDRAYFIGTLRAKILEIINETNRLNKESQDFATLKDFAASTRGEHGALVKTVSALRGTQRDYEALLESFARGVTNDDIRAETRELQQQSRELTAEVQELLNEREGRELELTNLQETTRKYETAGDSLLHEMSAEDQAKYRELQDELQRQSVMEEQLIKELESLKHGERAKMEEVRSPCPSRPKDKVQLGKSTMTDRTPSSNIFVFCRQELSFVPLKKEAAQVYSRIRDLQSTLEDVRQQINRPPVQELKRLVDQIKQENAEVSALERQYRTLQDIMSTIQQQGTVSSAGTASYPLSGYQDRYEELTAELKSSEAENLRKLEQLSKNVDALNELPITSEADVRKSGEQLRSTVGKVQHAQRMCEDLLQMNLEEYTRELRKIELLLVTLNKEKQQRQTDISKWEKEFQIGGDIKVVLTKRNEVKNSSLHSSTVLT
ncbi:hypothetical protein RvY_15356-2 [Ramazzottius varieornatus]|uniref:Uncharacterized protein n=1 Tax=Ramazzottius varieornatus TaxID=947166 RepID=A0A1D1VUM4_RAMVA|nr:hypothetical protein RvY_15356-2 [Ramazzottius varieornatus]